MGVADRATAYVIDPQRSAAVLEQVIGWDWDGILSHDGFASYDRADELEGAQAIRPAVLNRKVWGGNRTWVGARAQSVLMSVLEMCRRQSRSVLDHVSQTLRAFGNPLLPRPQLLPGR